MNYKKEKEAIDVFGTCWLKLKTKTVYKGERLGEKYDVFEGTFDLGGKKMVTLKMYPNSEVQTEDGNTVIPVKVNKWVPKKRTQSSKPF
jgi:hypothetical protein